MSTYFSLRDILAEEERVPCVWHVDAKGVGYLDASSGDDVRGAGRACAAEPSHS